MEKDYERIPNSKVLDEVKKHELLMKTVVDSIRIFLCDAWAYKGIERVESICGMKLDKTDKLGMLSSDLRKFLELLYLLASVNKTVEDALMEDVSKNDKKLTSQAVQKEIVRICARETINSIMSEVGDSNFSLILEGKGMSWHEHVSLVVRFVNKTGAVTERFLGIVHVPEENTNAPFLNSAIKEYLRKTGVQFEKLRCCSYNGSSLLCKIVNNLRRDILKEQKGAQSIHCLSHQFQLTVVTVGKYNCKPYDLFLFMDGFRDFLKDMPIKLEDPLKKDELAKIMKSVNAISAVFTSAELVYYDAIVGLITDYSRVIEFLEFTVVAGSSLDQSYEASWLLEAAGTFEFALNLHLMRDIVGLTNQMLQLLEKRETEIEEAMSFFAVVNQKLGVMKDHGWVPLFTEVLAFCKKNKIAVPDMASTYVAIFSLQEKGDNITNLQYYHDELVHSVVEAKIKEITGQFTESNVDLLLCVSAMNPKNSFSSFSKDKMVRFAKLFPSDFTPEEIDMLDYELQRYIIDMKSSPDFKDLDGTEKLAEKLVEMQRVKEYPLVYRVIELALTLPIVAPAIERVVSSGKVLKKWLNERRGCEWLNDCLVTYIEKDIFRGIDCDVIIDQFETSMGSLGPH